MKPILVVAPATNWLAEAAFRIRLAALVEPMQRRGFDWQIRPRPAGPLGRLAFARSARNYHAVILHRKMIDPYEARALRRNLQPPRRILMDIDDATMYHETTLGTLARRRLEKRFTATCKILDLACTGNDYLADIFQKRGVPTRIFPTVVDPAHYPIKHHAPTPPTAPPRLVWIGSASTLKYLEAALPILEKAAQQTPGLRLTVICNHPPTQTSTLPIDFIPWSLETEAAALAQADIGIAPMPEDRWTLGKCGFKIVQYMAAGLPTIASPVGANISLVNSSPPAGLLPESLNHWPAAIKQLADNPTLRQTLGTAGRQRIESELCLEKIADHWAQALL